MAFDVWAQADVVAVRLTLGPKDEAGLIEKAFLQAISAGAATSEDLADVFGLAPRLVTDVLGDLWRAGRISVQLGAEQEPLAVTASGRSELEAASQGQQFSSTSSANATEELIIERLTGRVLPVWESRRRPSETQDPLIPVMSDDRSHSTVTSSELADALTRVLERKSDGYADRSSGLQVLEAHLQPELLQMTPRRRYVAIRVSAHLSAAGELSLAVVDDRLSVTERTAATSRLQALLDELPQSPFTRRVRALATQEPLASRGIDQTVSELDRVVSSMEECAPEQRQRSHDRARGLLWQVATFAQWLALREMEVEVVATSKDHQRALAELIDSAERQVVLMESWVRLGGLERLGRPVRDALKRGVQIVLVWGIDGGTEGLGVRERAWLDDIGAHAKRNGHTGRFLYSRHRAARSHAKLAVADDRKMLVTSKNYLSNSDFQELGVLLTTTEDEASPAIESALRYAHDKMPDPGLARSLNYLRGAFGPRREPDLAEPPMPAWRAELGTEQASPAQVRVWAAGWAEAASAVTAELERPRPTVEVISDLQHRGVLRNALSTAVRRVLIASDKVSDTALTGEIVERARIRAGAGLEVAIRYQQAPDASAQGRLDELAEASQEEGVAPPDLIQDPANHMKVVLQDDTILVGSLNPLSVDANLRHRRSTGELGVRISSAPLSDSIWHHITHGEPLAERHGRTESQPRQMHSSALAQDLLDAASHRSFDELTQLVRTHGLAKLMESHAQFALPSELLTPIVAAGLAVDLTDGSDPRESAGLLVGRALEVGNWAVANLARAYVSAEDFRPRQELVDALAEGWAECQSLLAGATMSARLTSEEVEALRVADLVGALLGDVHPERVDLSVPSGFLEGISAAVGRLESLAAAYWQRYGPLPDSPPTQDTATEDRAALQVLWSAAAEAVAALGRYRTGSDIGDALQRYLYREGGEMALLQRALDRADAHSVKEWHASHVMERVDDWIDDAVHRAGQPKRIDASRRRSFLHHRRRIVKAVEELLREVRRQETRAGQAWDSEQLDQLRSMLDAADALHEQLQLEILGPERYIVQREVSRLRAWRDEGRKTTPQRTWQSWPFVSARRQSAASDNTGDLLGAVCEDLVKDRTPAEAVHDLAADGDLGQAEISANELEQAGLIGSEELESLHQQIEELRSEAQRRIDDGVEGLLLQCRRGGLDPNELRIGAIPVRGRVLESELELASQRTRVEEAFEAQRSVVRSQLDDARDVLSSSWAEYVAMLVDSGELQLALLGLQQPGGVRRLPATTPPASWPWRRQSPARLSEWFDPSVAFAPPGLRQSFAPHPDDTAGLAAVHALESLGRQDPDAARRWVDAVHDLIHDPGVEPRPQVSEGEEGLVASFLLPSVDGLPRLRWEGETLQISIGETWLKPTMLRLSLDDSRGGSEGPVMEMADVLTLLGCRDKDGQPAVQMRAGYFLRLVCSRLPLAEVIDPADMPAELSEQSRLQLTWLLTLLGMAPRPIDVDRLRIWSGGHPGVLWALVDALRTEVSSDGFDQTASRSRLAPVFIRGIEADLKSNDALLVLGLGLATQYLQLGCSEGDLIDAFDEQGISSGLIPEPERLRIVSAGVKHLKEAGYIHENEGGLYSCNCTASLELARWATAERLEDLGQRLCASPARG